MEWAEWMERRLRQAGRNGRGDKKGNRGKKRDETPYYMPLDDEISFRQRGFEGKNEEGKEARTLIILPRSLTLSDIRIIKMS